MGKQNLDILGMSDEDFAKLSAPPSVEDEGTAEITADQTNDEDKETGADEEPENPAASQEDTQGTADASPEDPDETPEDGEEAPPPTSSSASSAADPHAEISSSSADKEQPPVKNQEEKPVSESPNYEAFYRQVMAPFKANGKTIELQSPEEVVQLMQMGANYTRKMQEIAKYKKHLMMLENNQLLDEGQLSFLIDLHQKNPEAIKKLLKDAEIDPMDLDTSSQSEYKSGSHAVSDQEVLLATTIDDIKMMPGGGETLQSINGWDQASKKILWENPKVMSDIHAHRVAGIYDQITNEMNRRQALGILAPGTPFLAAYKAIGDELNARGAFQRVAQPATQAPAPVVGRTPVARTVSPPTKTQDNQKVRAAASPRTAPRAASPAVNPLAMSDEEFLKHEELLKKMGPRI